MPLGQLLIRRLTLWLGSWLLVCVAVVFSMGQKDVQREFEQAQEWVGEIHQLMRAQSPLSDADFALLQARLAQGKSEREVKETRRELLAVASMLTLMVMGSGLVVWWSLRRALGQPLGELVQQLKHYEHGQRKPALASGQFTHGPLAQEFLDLQQGLQHMMGTLDAEQQRGQELLHRMLTLQERERAAIAQDLHDHLGQLLTSINVNSAYLIKRTHGPALESAQAIHSQSQQMMAWLRGSLRELKPHLLLEVSLKDAVLDLLESWSARKGWFTDFAWQEGPDPVAESQRIQLFRIAQEALTNVAKHSDARRVTLASGRHAPSGMWMMVIANDGLKETPVGPPSLGLTGLQERARSMGGEVSWSRQHDRFELLCKIPLTTSTLDTPS